MAKVKPWILVLCIATSNQLLHRPFTSWNQLWSFLHIWCKTKWKSWKCWFVPENSQWGSVSVADIHNFPNRNKIAHVLSLVRYFDSTTLICSNNQLNMVKTYESRISPSSSLPKVTISFWQSDQYWFICSIFPAFGFVNKKQSCRVDSMDV